MAFFQIHNFHTEIKNLDIYISKEQASATIKDLKEQMFEALKEHLYGSIEAIDKIEKIKFEIQRVKRLYDIL